MSEHPKFEILSGYHDGELEHAERERIENHLASCGQCRHRLDGVRGLSARLNRLATLEPPDELRGRLERRVADLEVRKDPVQRLESMLRGVPLQPSLAVIFALIIALAVIMFLFVHGVDRHRRGLPVRLEPAASSEAPEKPSATIRQLAGRTFEHTDQGWREQGLKGDRIEQMVLSASAPGRRWLARHPSLVPVSRLPGRVLLEVDGHVVELVNPAPP